MTAPSNPLIDLEFLRGRFQDDSLTPARRQQLQQELFERSTPAQRAELDALLRRLPAAQTADIRDLVYR